jgi:hypothetical protein
MECLGDGGSHGQQIGATFLESFAVSRQVFDQRQLLLPSGKSS